MKLLLLVAACLSVGSCAVLRLTSTRDMVEVRSQSLDNGYLIALSADRPIGEVTAFITRGRWLVVTVADSLLDVGDLATSKPSFVDSVEVTKFPSVLQLAFRLTVRVEHVEIVQNHIRPDVWISLFSVRAPSRKD